MGMRKYPTRKKQDHLFTFEKKWVGATCNKRLDWHRCIYSLVGKKNAKNVAFYMTGNMTLGYSFVL